MNNSALATERQVKSAANGSKSMPEMMGTLGYNAPYPGGNTTKRFKRILGESVYNEIRCGMRKVHAKTRWTKVRVNTRRS